MMRALIVAGLCLSLGCGSKTGLKVPLVRLDAGPTPDVGVDAGDPNIDECIELPPREPPEFIDIEFVARIATADVLFLVDVTGSMVEEIDQIRRTLRDEIAPGLVSSIPDVHMAVAEFADYPEFPYGDDRDIPFRLLQQSTSDLSLVQTAVDRLPERSGSDVPESHVQALWHVATGQGAGRYVPPASCEEGAVGYPCFRENGSRIVLLFTDAEFHNGPLGEYPYDMPMVLPRPATYSEATDALNAIGAKVLGLFSGGVGAGQAEAHLRAMARDTGAVTELGEPVMENIGTAGQRLGSGVISTVNRLVEEVPIDIDVIVEDWPDDDFDTLDFVTAIETTGATPADGAQDLGDRYDTVRPGTRVGFRIHLANERVERGEDPISYYMTIVLRGDGVTRLRETTVEIVIPSINGLGCRA